MGKVPINGGSTGWHSLGEDNAFAPWSRPASIHSINSVASPTSKLNTILFFGCMSIVDK